MKSKNKSMPDTDFKIPQLMDASLNSFGIGINL